ncbi:sterol carrier family protein [Corynebacterium sp.]|uniref:sterol carrier family protein n=1 Tax=Corynebacterium sp. TaxID=1720 RepID=UPI0026DFC136|nr:sterol carrier family protein [Corynebacterium sp.]MDO5513409.1 sterol carrier family protein [Corynebacterium sp.]
MLPCEVLEWVRDPVGVDKPPRAALAAAVRTTARALAAHAPGKSVEVRVPPFVAVQCIDGPAHTRGTPPNVFETDPLTWLQLAVGELHLDAAITRGLVDASGPRVGEVGELLPVISL